MNPEELKEGDYIMHEARSMPCLITRRVYYNKVLIGYEYVPWRGSEWAIQTNPPRFIKIRDEFAGDRINFKSVLKVMNPKIRVVAV